MTANENEICAPLKIKIERGEAVWFVCRLSVRTNNRLVRGDFFLSFLGVKIPNERKVCGGECELSCVSSSKEDLFKVVSKGTKGGKTQEARLGAMPVCLLWFVCVCVCLIKIEEKEYSTSTVSSAIFEEG